MRKAYVLGHFTVYSTKPKEEYPEKLKEKVIYVGRAGSFIFAEVNKNLSASELSKLKKLHRIK